MIWKTLQSTTVHSSYHATLKRNHVRLPDGNEIEDFYTVTIPDAAMVAAITVDNKILLKREYRFACGEDVIERPAGMFNKGETDAEQVAKRELLEETGYRADNWTYLGSTWESTSKLTNHMHLFLATNCHRVAAQHLDPNEHLDVFEIPLKETVDMVMNGKINANSTAHLILKVAKMLGE